MKFDARDPQHAIDGMPFDELAKIRAEEPVCESSGGWFLSRREEILPCLEDVETFVADLSTISGIPSWRDIAPEELFLSEIAEPRHGRMRRLYNSCFARHRLNKLGSYVEDACHRLLDDLLATRDGIADLHAGYALPLPSLVLSRMMGLPEEAAQKFIEWSVDGTLMQRTASPGVDPEGPPIRRYFAAQIAQRRAKPEDAAQDVLRTLMEAEIDGEPLSDHVIAIQLQFMVLAGVHTTRSFLCHLVHRLLVDPELMRTLDDDRTLIPNYIEESLRHDSPVQGTGRRCTRDTRLGGVAMREGDFIEVGLGSANRDESAYADPEVFRLDRKDPRDHLAFGAASHICPGATLARLEGVTCVEVLLDRVVSMEVVPGALYPHLPGSLSERAIPAKLVARRADAGRGRN